MEHKNSGEVVNQQTVQRWLSATTGLNAVVCVSLFTQKSGDHSSVGTLAYLALAAAGVYLIALLAFSFYYRNHQQDHKIATLTTWISQQVSTIPLIGASGILLLSISLIGLDTARPDEVPDESAPDLPVDPDDEPFKFSSPSAEPALPRSENTDSKVFALRGLQLAYDKRMNRMSIHVINRTDEVQLIRRLAFAAQSDGSGECQSEHWIWELEKTITIAGDGSFRGQVKSKRGPLEGFKTDVGGSLEMGCDAFSLQVNLRTAVLVEPHAVGVLTLDLPRILRGKVSRILYSMGPDRPDVVGKTDDIEMCFPEPAAFHVAASTATSGDYDVTFSTYYGELGEQSPPGLTSPLPC
ncbi:hypothetical protein O7634_29620 [Micromonospora sp. WMMD1120]|uniref:hypothetical protein n=1 Tax=Micromonospora sp. WMMD1120 TaxID=3016106 RepID=UPI002416A2A5|nr:hypothetical protein [Micromonospora sp. WMMD1120]MDG4810937.1 hypothetical protein [Micromonospora sp. WMMD1120]